MMHNSESLTGLGLMLEKSWSTHGLQPSDRFAYWRDAVSEAVLNVVPQNPLGTKFAGDIACNKFDDMRIAAFSSTPHQIVRSFGHIRRSEGEH